MIGRLLALIVDEGKWLTASLSLAGVAVTLLAIRYRGSTLTVRQRILSAMNLSAGVMIGTMAFGHLLAVVTKLVLGTLRQGSLVIFFGIGISLLIPSVMVVRHTRALLADTAEDPQRTMFVNGWLAITLLALGLHNLPLAAPALLTIAYRARSGGFTGWVIATLALVFYGGLFVASVIFATSGMSFEEFRGIAIEE
jgi:hypothetical protein